MTVQIQLVSSDSYFANGQLLGEFTTTTCFMVLTRITGENQRTDPQNLSWHQGKGRWFFRDIRVGTQVGLKCHVPVMMQVRRTKSCNWVH